MDLEDMDHLPRFAHPFAGLSIHSDTCYSYLPMRRLRTVLLLCALALWSMTHAASPVILSEFMADNTHTLSDEDGSFDDWIEIYNTSSSPVNLDGWRLTDDAHDLTKWRFPATNLDAGGFLVVFASRQDRRVAGAPLHTQFKLSADGEYLALVEPDGVTIATEFAPKFPRQVPDVSFGIGLSSQGCYFLTPTPGALNSSGAGDLGPLITDVSHSPDVPAAAQDLLVTARVLPTFNAISNVTLRYRIMFSAEALVAMNDSGVNGDVMAGDGIWSAIIPANAATNAQMIRYYVVATDGQANTSRWPLF